MSSRDVAHLRLTIGGVTAMLVVTGWLLLCGRSFTKKEASEFRRFIYLIV